MAVDDLTEHLTLLRLVNQDRLFYPTMGPFLSRRHIVREVGGPVWDEDNKRWYVARLGRQVVGFCAARDDTTKVAFLSAYTLSEHRHQGVYRFLFLARLADYTNRPTRAVCTAASLPIFLANGYTSVRARGSFTEVTRNAS